MLASTAEHQRKRAGDDGSPIRWCRTGIVVLTIVATVLAISLSESIAKSDGPDQMLAFDIPAQSLETALEAFGARSSFQVLYETALTVGRHSHELKGTFTPEAALQRLLSGTGLSFDYIEDRAFTLLLAPPQPSRSMADFSDYLGTVQTGVMATLCQRAETRPGLYNVAMQFRIDASGRIEDARLLNSTGVKARDTAVATALSHLAIGRIPPADMPQPVTMMLKSDDRGARECPGGHR
jgi:TonB C terminal